jgi:hypothetical protein
MVAILDNTIFQVKSWENRSAPLSYLESVSIRYFECPRADGGSPCNYLGLDRTPGINDLSQ